MGVPHIEIDLFPSEEKIIEDITRANSGWVAEANPWQIPAAISGQAAIVVFLDYDNVVNYVRLLIRGYQEWRVQGFTWAGFKQSIIHRTILDLGRIVYMYGKANRAGWRKEGLLGDARSPSLGDVRCISPAELSALSDLLNLE